MAVRCQIRGILTGVRHRAICCPFLLQRTYLPAVSLSQGSLATTVRGVYFTTDLRLTPGSFLDLSMTLPADYSKGTEVFIRTQGRVVREEMESAGRTGVAMVIQKYEIVRTKPNRS